MVITSARWRRILAAGIVLIVVACNGPAAGPQHSGDPENGISIDNATGQTMVLLYERPDGGTEPLGEIAAGATIVIDSVFAGRDGLCRTGRLVAQSADGAEVDELYVVCRGRTWTISAT